MEKKIDINDFFQPRERRSTVGRPKEYPFASAEVEQDCKRRAQRMAELYYDGSDANSKKNYRLTKYISISKSSFWAIVYIYLYQEGQLVKDNKKYFIDMLSDLLGFNKVGERSFINRRINELMKAKVYLPDRSAGMHLKQAATYEKNNPYYNAITHLWRECSE